MNYMGAWLNTNSAAVQAVTTFASLLAVVGIGIWSNWNTNRTVQEMQAQRSLSVRPRLEVWPNAAEPLKDVITIEDSTAMGQPLASLHLVNVGAGKAFNVRIRVPEHPDFFVKDDWVVIPPETAVMVRYPPPRGTLSIVVAYQDLDEVTHGLTIHFDQNHKLTVNRAKPRKD